MFVIFFYVVKLVEVALNKFTWLLYILLSSLKMKSPIVSKALAPQPSHVYMDCLQNARAQTTPCLFRDNEK